MNILPMGLGVCNGLVAPQAPIHASESARSSGWIGRHRIGDDVMLRLQTVGPSALSVSGSVWPDAAPAARIYSNVGKTSSQLIPVDATSGGAVGTFRGGYTPGAGNPPGRYFVLYGYTVGGRWRSHLAPFEVIPGGHPSSNVLAMFHIDLPAGQVLLAHQQSGRVTTGHGPYLDEGISFHG